MKVRFFVALCIVMMVFMSCSSVPEKDVVVSKGNDFLDGGFIQGERIVLRGNPTTGYSWEYELSDDTVVSVNEKITYLGAKGVMGAPSKFEYTFKGKKDGTAKIIYKYCRSWESVQPLETLIFTVTVKGSKVSVVQN